MSGSRNNTIIPVIGGAAIGLGILIIIGSVILGVFRLEKVERDGPWVVYRMGATDLADREALSIMLSDRTNEGFSMSGDHFTVRLGTDEDSLPRTRLVEIVDEFLENLPPGHPYTIEVETLEDAIAARERQVNNVRERIERLKRIHADGEP
jgi:hypothetical protein